MPIQTALDSIGQNQGSPFGFKNRIINGGMTIDQRYSGAGVSSASNSTYIVDRWRYEASQSAKVNVGQNLGSGTLPSGFTKYMGVSSTSSYSLLSSDRFQIGGWIEGYNVADMDFGSTTAQTFTLSFWVKSSLTGTFGGTFLGYDGGSSFRSYTWSYTINQANTWEYKTITARGDTSSAISWGKTNNWGLFVCFSLGAGSEYSTAANTWTSGLYYAPPGVTSVVSTNAATFQVTGVQLEKGNQATAFDSRSISQELTMCQRYYQQIDSTTAPYSYNGSVGGSDHIFGITYPVQMRAAPAINFSGSFLSYYFTSIGGSQTSITISSVAVNSSVGGFRFYHGRQGATGTSCWADFGGSTAKFTINSEL